VRTATSGLTVPLLSLLDPDVLIVLLVGIAVPIFGISGFLFWIDVVPKDALCFPGPSSMTVGLDPAFEHADARMFVGTVWVASMLVT
jgi:hypothetical protein